MSSRRRYHGQAQCWVLTQVIPHEALETMESASMENITVRGVDEGVLEGGGGRTC